MLPPNSLQLIRHATLLLQIDDRTLLIDPMLSPKEAMPPIVHSGNDRRIPMVDLPLAPQEVRRLIQQIDAVLVTHVHRDHWDDVARALLPKDIPLFCQPPDADVLRAQGFQRVQPVESQITWGSVRLHRTGGQHGRGDLAREMGPVSGFVFQNARGNLYLAGDTVWCPEVQHALNTWQPLWTIVNAGAAQFVEGDPITMTHRDLEQVARTLPTTRIIAVHLDTINHCREDRAALRAALDHNGLSDRVWIPEDGAVITL